MKKRTVIIIAATALAILVIAGIAAAIFFRPAVKGAKRLQKDADYEHFTFDIELDLDKQEFKPEEQALLAMMAGVFGAEADELYRLRIEGSVWEDTIHANVYCRALREPLTEVYLSEEGEDLVNVAMLYRAALGSVKEKLGFFAMFVPDWEGDAYFTFAQLEKIFELDLTGVRTLELPDLREKIAGPKTTLALAFMDREKREGELPIFLGELEDYDIRLQIDGEDRPVPVRIGVDFKKRAYRAMHMDGSFLLGAGEELTLPESMAGEQTTDMLATVWGFVKQFLAK